MQQTRQEGVSVATMMLMTSKASANVLEPAIIVDYGHCSACAMLSRQSQQAKGLLRLHPR